LTVYFRFITVLVQSVFQGNQLQHVKFFVLSKHNLQRITEEFHRFALEVLL